MLLELLQTTTIHPWNEWKTVMKLEVPCSGCGKTFERISLRISPDHCCVDLALHKEHQIVANTCGSGACILIFLLDILSSIPMMSIHCARLGSRVRQPAMASLAMDEVGLTAAGKPWLALPTSLGPRRPTSEGGHGLANP
ncbi:hypothetical protein NL676_020909 [Syzygium grande]|nr:hypothetical protein NL676_020909 [Syzygium grande]